jgi:leucyl aminopeptidase
MKMGSFLSVAKGSDEPPVFLEVSFEFENHSKFYDSKHKIDKI